MCTSELKLEVEAGASAKTSSRRGASFSLFSLFSPSVLVSEIYFSKERELSFLEDSLTPGPKYQMLQSTESYIHSEPLSLRWELSWHPLGQGQAGTHRKQHVFTSVPKGSISSSVGLAWLALQCSVTLDSKCFNSASVSACVFLSE